MNATQNPAKPAYVRESQTLYYIEVTDTFGGEANYSWVTRHVISATTERGAVNKFSKASGMKWRGVGCERYDSKSGATCFFISHYEHAAHANYSSYSTDERPEFARAFKAEHAAKIKAANNGGRTPELSLSVCGTLHTEYTKRLHSLGLDWTLLEMFASK